MSDTKGGPRVIAPSPRGMASRAFWRSPAFRRLLGPFDQGLSSLSNFLPAALVAKASTGADFALVSIVLLATTFGLGVVRSLTGEIQIAENRRREDGGAAPDRVPGSATAAVLVSIVLGGARGGHLPRAAWRP